MEAVQTFGRKVCINSMLRTLGWHMDYGWMMDWGIGFYNAADIPNHEPRMPN